MPLFEKARIEVYLPELDRPEYADLLAAFDREFSHAFGGCSLIRNVEGAYLSRIGIIMRDRVNLIYADIPFTFSGDFQLLSDYADKLRESAALALQEEAILVTVCSVHHSLPSTSPT